MVFMPKTAERQRQPEAGAAIRRWREDHGLLVLDFCQIVSAQTTRWGKVNLDRNTLARIEAGMVPLSPRRYAIAKVIGSEPRDIWELPGGRLVPQIGRTA